MKTFRSLLLFFAVFLLLTTCTPEETTSEVKGVYTIRFEPNTGTGTMASIVKNKGENFNLPANEFFKTDYYFSHWNTDPDNNGTLYNNNESVSDLTEINTVVILFAQWISQSDF